MAKIMARLKVREAVLTRLILTMPGLSSRSMVINELETLFSRAGLALVRQELVTLFRYLDPLKTSRVKLTKMLKFVMDFRQ